MSRRTLTLTMLASHGHFFKKYVLNFFAPHPCVMFQFVPFWNYVWIFRKVPTIDFNFQFVLISGYIDRVRQLQQENSKLVHQVKTFESYQSREISNVKGMYDKQVEDLKAALDTMNKQYNQLKVGAEGLLQENEELKSK